MGTTYYTRRYGGEDTDHMKEDEEICLFTACNHAMPIATWRLLRDNITIDETKRPVPAEHDGLCYHCEDSLFKRIRWATVLKFRKVRGKCRGLVGDRSEEEKGAPENDYVPEQDPKEKPANPKSHRLPKLRARKLRIWLVKKLEVDNFKDEGPTQTPKPGKAPIAELAASDSVDLISFAPVEMGS